MKRILIFMFLIVLMATTTRVAAEENQNTIDTAKQLMLQNYQALTNELCGQASTNYIELLKQNNIKSRLLQLYTDPTDSYTTHVAAEVWIVELNQWVYMDPTFNGYYTERNGSHIYSAFELRDKVKNNQLSELKWNSNGLVKSRYDIANYYINPLYMLKGLMYRPDLSTNKMYSITDDWSPTFNKTNTVFAWADLTFISNPSQIDQPAKWGVDRGSYATLLNWVSYAGAIPIVDGTSIEINAVKGGIKTTIPVEIGEIYVVRFPVNIYSGNVTVSLNDGYTSTYNVILAGDRFVASKRIVAKSTSLTIYIYQDTPIHYKVDTAKIELFKFVNDFSWVTN